MTKDLRNASRSAGAPSTEDLSAIIGLDVNNLVPQLAWPRRRKPGMFAQSGAPATASITASPHNKRCYGPPAAPGTGASNSELANQARHNAAEAASRYWDPLNIFWFRSQVQNKGPWDYKQYSRGFQDFGNYNYGYTGSALGLATDFLLGQAGRAQQAAGTSRREWGNPGFLGFGDLGGTGSYGDDPRDQEMIKRGIADRRNGC